MAAALATQDAVATGGVRKIGVTACRTNDEVLRAHGLDAESLAERIGVEVPARS